ncbi:plasmid mobilization protein, partial [Trueperella pyogenes]|uniref:plasmid mobilization protein n=1 Tax=Trueperella pyogenes TaxID=1661 RepID=UPI00345DF92F
MSAKNLDNHNRWRSKTIAFRVSPEENEQIEIAVRLSGLTKQDYITRRLLDRAVVVQGNPRVYKALRDQLAAVLGELRLIGQNVLLGLVGFVPGSTVVEVGPV